MTDHDETRLSEGLREHVDRLSAGHVSLRSVQQRAGRIRRRRRIAVAVAGAAVAAVAVPTAMFALPGPAGDDAPAPAASGTASPTAAPGPVDVTLPGDPAGGAAPGLAWSQGSTLHLPDGTERQAEHSYDAFVVLGARAYGSWSDDGGNRFVDVSDEEGLVETRPTTDAPVVSRDGTMVTWGEPDGAVTVAGESGTTDLGRQPEPVMPVAVAGDARCEPDEATSCTVHLNAFGEASPSVVSSSGRSSALDGLVKVNDVDGSLVAGQTSYDEGRACSELRDRTTGKRSWRTCDHALGRLSPDASHLLAIPSDVDGLGTSTLHVLAAGTGEPVATWSVDQGFISSQVWEDGEHVLVVRHTYPTASWDVLRLGLDGSVERVVDPVEGTDDARPFTVAGNR